MIRTSRITRFGRAAALAAGILSVVGSFGLHPEPEAAGCPPEHPEWASTPASAEAAPHACLACLAHRAIPLPRLNAVVFAPRPASPAAVSAAPVPIARLEAKPREGRAPPARG
ncbi:MAG TPA: hypothetical protein VKH43_03575 [Thermoanaerobaculia bacterium]|nr:hypothetical protein [Thermoanaerobaculia bacterium]